MGREKSPRRRCLLSRTRPHSSPPPACPPDLPPSPAHWKVREEAGGRTELLVGLPRREHRPRENGCQEAVGSRHGRAWDAHDRRPLRLAGPTRCAGRRGASALTSLRASSPPWPTGWACCPYLSAAAPHPTSGTQWRWAPSVL
jgi:hypothetical protein